MMNKKKDLELYIHIPFCIKKCNYCDFLSGSLNPERIQSYKETLLMEIDNYSMNHLYSWKDYLVTTIFIGGGTPSSIEASYIKEILDRIRGVFSIAEKKEIEITIEANPGTLSKEKLLIYKEAGINRLSMGLQSAQDSELKELGRIHTFTDFLNNYALARECGFQNINIDLMSALPGQTIASWEDTLNKVLDLEPEHISAYSLIIEEGTPFYMRYHGHKELLPDEESERQMYYQTSNMLKQRGYERYEISNYAKKGFACRHNLGYWERTSYLGLGLGAASLIEEKRFVNPLTQEEYKTYVNQGSHHSAVEVLNKKEQMEEFMFLGLRKTEGIKPMDFLKYFMQPIDEIYGETIQLLIEQGLLYKTNTRILLTDFGIDVSNHVLSKFLLDE